MPEHETVQHARRGHGGRRLRVPLAGCAGLLAAAVVVALAVVPNGTRAAFLSPTVNQGNELATEAAFPDYRTAALSNGPVVYHSFDDPFGSGTAAASRGVAGTYNGAAAPTSMSPGAVAPSTRKAVTFRPLTYADADSSSTLTGTPLKVTLEAWVRTGVGGAVVSLLPDDPATPGRAQLYVNPVNGEGQACIGLTLQAAATQRVCGSDAEDTKVWTSADQSNPSWHHLVAVVDPTGAPDTAGSTDGTQVIVYVDGTVVFDRGLTGTWPSSVTGRVRVGSTAVQTSPSLSTWSGDIDEVAVYSGALSSSQVTTHHNEGRDTGGSTTTTYVDAVMNSAPHLYWQLEETPAAPAATLKDTAGSRTGTYHGYPDLGVPGAPTGTTPTAAGLAVGLRGVNGISTGAVRSTPAAFSTEVWFNSSGGTGPLIGFTPTTSANVPDRAVYLTVTGDLAFSMSSPRRTLTTGRSYLDGQWHLVTATMSASGRMRLYVDGDLAAADASAAATAPTSGLWRWGGGGNYTGYPTQPGAPFFTGLLDEASVYDEELSAEDVAIHWGAKF